jgi:hypothetical protein
MIFVAIILLGIIPAMIAHRKGRNPVAWWLYGSALFLIAFPHSLLARDLSRAPCPRCAELIKLEARICPHCRSEIPLTLSAR